MTFDPNGTTYIVVQYDEASIFNHHVAKMIIMKAVALLLVLLPAFIASQTTGDCDLNCYFNTSCVAGSADFGNHSASISEIDGQPLDIHAETISPNGYHCDCPDGLTGLRCGRTPQDLLYCR
jgi:hypothetical protein